MTIIIGTASENNIGNNLPLTNTQLPFNLSSGIPIGTIIPYYNLNNLENINLLNGWEICDGHTLNNSNHDYDELVSLGLLCVDDRVYLPNLSENCLVGAVTNNDLNTYITDNNHNNFVHNHQLNNTHTLSHYHTNLTHSHRLYYSADTDVNSYYHSHEIETHTHTLDKSHYHYTQTHGHAVHAIEANADKHSHSWSVPVNIDEYSTAQASVTTDSISGYNQSNNPTISTSSVSQEKLSAKKTNGSDSHKLNAANSASTLSSELGAKSSSSNYYTGSSSANLSSVTLQTEENINTIDENFNDINTNNSSITSHYDSIPKINLYYIIKCK